MGTPRIPSSGEKEQNALIPADGTTIYQLPKPGIQRQQDTLLSGAHSDLDHHRHCPFFLQVLLESIPSATVLPRATFSPVWGPAGTAVVPASTLGPLNQSHPS